MIVNMAWYGEHHQYGMVTWYGEPNWPIPVHLRKEFRQLPVLYAYPGALRCFRPSAGEPNWPIPVHLRKEFLHPPALCAYPGAVRVPAANSQHDSSMTPA